AEASGGSKEPGDHYKAAPRHSTAYYGQLARARLGLSDIALRRPPEPDAAQRAAIANNEIVRAVDILYAMGERELIVSVMADVAERTLDVTLLVGIAELTARHEDARSMLLLGKEIGRAHV